MHEHDNRTEVLTPSASSLALCSLGVFLGIIFVVLPRLGADALLKLLLGNDANVDLINTSRDNYGPAVEQVLGNDLLGRAVVFGVWMFIGLCAFIIIMSITKLIGTVEEEKRELNYVHQTGRDKLIKSDILTFLFKIGVAAVWAGFVVFTLRFVLSFFAVTGYLAWNEGSVADWAQFALMIVALFAAIHVQVILARLLVGKTRLWQA